MATVRIVSRQGTFTLDADEDDVVRVVTEINDSFEKRAGVWITGGAGFEVEDGPAAGHKVMVWVPAAQAEITVRFEGAVPDELSDYTAGSGR